ncbi:MAG: hypothetical protein IKJ05_01720 [Oscillospiraceae bacterium]|nr:hypothetical protein [Oscillospiraceae bacterium]
MFFTLVMIVGVLIYFASMFTGGKSLRTIREQFYGNYYAEDGLINNEDKPNSPEAFQKCIDNNIGIKTEVFLSADRRAVISAYDDLSREYGVDKKVTDTELDELEKLGIMSVTELINMVDGRVPLILELKVGSHNNVLCRVVADAIIASEKNNIAICSFHSGIVGWFKHTEKNIFRGVVSAPAKEFKSLPKIERWMTGNLANNANCRPNFMLYRDRPHSVFVKFAITSGVLNGVWTIEDAETGKKKEAEGKEMIVVRGFMPETVHFKDLPVVEKTEQQIAAEKKMEERASKRKAKMEERQQQEAIRERRISEILADDDDFEDEDTDIIDEIKEEITEVVADVKEEAGEIIQEVKEELTEIREKIIAEE